MKSEIVEIIESKNDDKLDNILNNLLTFKYNAIYFVTLIFVFTFNQ